MNLVIKQLLGDDKITQDEYDILFEDKSNWLKKEYLKKEIYDSDDSVFHAKFEETTHQYRFYPDTLNKIIDLQKESNKIDLSYLIFLNFDFIRHIDLLNFKENISFSNCKFYGSTSFMNTCFEKKVYFDNATFFGETDFSFTTFKMGGSFIKTNFRENAFFNDGTYTSDIVPNLSEMYFRGSYFEKIIDFSNSSFDKLDLTNTFMNITNFNSIKNSNSNKTFIKIFANRETARIIKSHYEKQNNILEANKYFVIEQEKYIDELKKNQDNKTEGNKWVKLIPLRLNKLVSNFGTDWVRAILFLMIFGFFSLFIFMSLRYSLFTFPHEFYMGEGWHKDFDWFNIFMSLIILLFAYRLSFIPAKIKYFYIFFIVFILIGSYGLFFDSSFQNIISKLINPINAFKDDDTFNGYEAFGMLVRIVSATIIYQIIVAFRQNTRRS